MTNPSMPGLVKIGRSTRVPTERASDDDLSSTGIPKTFEPQYYAFFDDMVEAEKQAHIKLSKYHYGKEFFKTDVATAIAAIESLSVPFKKIYSKREDDRKAAQIRAAEKRKVAQIRAKKKAEREENIRQITEEWQDRRKRRKKEIILLMLAGFVLSGLGGSYLHDWLSTSPSLSWEGNFWETFLFGIMTALVPVPLAAAIIWNIWERIDRNYKRERFRNIETK
jgi:hypothetical protein